MNREQSVWFIGLMLLIGFVFGEFFWTYHFSRVVYRRDLQLDQLAARLSQSERIATDPRNQQSWRTALSELDKDPNAQFSDRIELESIRILVDDNNQGFIILSLGPDHGMTSSDNQYSFWHPFPEKRKDL